MTWREHSAINLALMRAIDGARGSVYIHRGRLDDMTDNHPDRQEEEDLLDLAEERLRKHLHARDSFLKGARAGDMEGALTEKDRRSILWALHDAAKRTQDAIYRLRGQLCDPDMDDTDRADVEDTLECKKERLSAYESALKALKALDGKDNQ